MEIAVWLLAGLAAAGGIWAATRGIRLIVRGLRAAGEDDGALWLIRGLRSLIVGICLGCAALGAAFDEVWLLVFAGLWLLEEIYETGVLASILRDGAHPHAAPGSARAR
ncbi:MAG TPA: hypothetical protein VFX14_22125 [Methylomirabilota bacterium]|nr:hypothetical protein [Methylomirabilota bacterium]